ncbi:uncharacterized protein MONOS_8845 [Monocercomonoides exilis]|uniref:uncharacterized protein n=1 Tax=Monocercomonoides exilis TaxID=2049356 RepID=UPI0035599D65|nr:hypothetical protein MONOS_8845 [Monocercomonoides exilis]
MSLSNDDNSKDEILTAARTEQFSKLFCELERCNEDEQMQKIEEINKLVEKMNKEEFESIFTEELFNKIHQMIEEEKMSLENAILLLKHFGYNKAKKSFLDYAFSVSFLSDRFEKMLVDEDRKNEEKNEKLLADICECYLLLCQKSIPDELLSIAVPCLLKFASKKKGNEEAQKEVEVALLALSNIVMWKIIEQKLYLKEIKEIIEYHQEHHNLTQLAYQSAWQFLIYRFIEDKSLEGMIVNELHFVEEARRKLEELTRFIDRKKEKEEDKKGKDTKEELIILRWIQTLNRYFLDCTMWNEDFIEHLYGIVQLFRAAKDNHREIGNEYLETLRFASINRYMTIDGLLKSGAINLFLEEMKQSTLDDDITWSCLHFYLNISERLKEKKKNEMEEAERKVLKRKIFERMEEDGFEDEIASLYGFMSFQNEKHLEGFSLNISDYFVNV